MCILPSGHLHGKPFKEDSIQIIIMIIIIIIKIMIIAMIIMIKSSPVSLISISPAAPTCAAVLWAVSTLQHKYHDHGYDGHDLEDN